MRQQVMLNRQKLNNRWGHCIKYNGAPSGAVIYDEGVSVDWFVSVESGGVESGVVVSDSSTGAVVAAACVLCCC